MRGVITPGSHACKLPHGHDLNGIHTKALEMLNFVGHEKDLIQVTRSRDKLNRCRTGSITINPNLSQEVEVFESAAAASNSPYGSCDDPPFGQSKAFTSDFIVQPGETNVYYLAMGGTLNTLVSANNEHNIAIGGLPNGASNPKWYDFNLNLAESTDFTSLNLSYNNTGGTSSSNGQNGFNVVTIEKGVATQNILSPYSSTYAGGNVVWSANQPIGLAWLP